MTKKFSSQQWTVLIGACLFQCAMIGLLVNCSGVLFAQIRVELGMSMTKISAFNTIKGVTGMIAAATITDLFFKMNKAWFLLINQLLMIGSFVVLILGADSWIWYFASVINGLSMCISTVAVPYILTQWFPRNAGFATGVAMAFSGIGGAIFSPLCAELIARFGWEVTILIYGAITLMLTIPGLLLMFRKRPETAREQASKPASDSASGKKQTGTFLLLSVALLAGGMGVQFAINVSMYAQSIGYMLSVGAYMTTMIMVGNLVSKFLYGWLCDMLGVWRATALMLVLAAGATLCFILVQSQLFILLAASLVFGCVYALSMVGISRCCAVAYDAGNYQKYLGLHVAVNSGTTAAFALLSGMIYDVAQSFIPVLLIILGTFALSLLSVMRLSKARQAA